MEYSANIVAGVLKRDFPDVAEKVISHIRTIFPYILSDCSQVETIISKICQHENVTIEELRNSTPTFRVIRKRRLMFGVILRLYRPDLLLNYQSGYLPPKVKRRLQKLFDISTKTLALDIRTIKSEYHIYSDVKENIEDLYNKIIESHGKKDNETGC